MQQVRAGLKAIYLSGWQIAADNNLAGGMYPDQSIYPANSGPELVKKINRTLTRADEIVVPYCITVDHDSLTDNSVTIRYRDSTKQERLQIENLPFF